MGVAAGGDDGIGEAGEGVLKQEYSFLESDWKEGETSNNHVTYWEMNGEVWTGGTGPQDASEGVRVRHSDIASFKNGGDWTQA
jgi:hypothetical protein